MSEVRLMKKLPCIKIDNMTAISSTMLTNNAQGIVVSIKLCKILIKINRLYPYF